MCIKKGKTCTYADQGGLVKRCYGGKYVLEVANKTTEEIGISIKYLTEEKLESDDECLMCAKYKRTCDGGTPCYRCVKHKDSQGNDKYVRCTYMKTGFMRESWAVGPYYLEEGRVTLRENWEEILNNSSTSTKYQIRMRKETERTLDDFVLDDYEILETSGEGLLCGIRAVIGSLESQTTFETIPSVDDLMNLLNDENFRSFEAETRQQARDNENNFYIDQLGAILYAWGLRQNPSTPLQLGYVLQDGRNFLVPTPHHENTVVIWIHSSSTEGNDEESLHHYSALKRKRRTKTKQSCQDTDQNTPRDYSTSSSDDEPANKRLRAKQRIDDDVEEFAENDSMRTSLLKTAFIALAMTAPDHEQPEPTSYGQAMKTTESQKWQEAVNSELNSLDQNETYEIIKTSEVPKEKRPITGRWVFKRKVLYDEKTGQYHNKYKARLVAKGFQQQEGIDYEEIFATVVKSSSYKILLALAAKLTLTVYLMDVKTAFLHGKLDHTIYMRPPPGMGIENGKILRLKKALYGLKQAPRLWYMRLTEYLYKLQFRMSAFDSCVFIHEENLLIVAIWVDDLLILAREEDVAQKFRKQMSQEFDMKDEGVCNYYLGMNVEQSEEGIFIHQHRYAKQVLNRFNLSCITPTKTPMTTDTKLRQEVNIKSTPEFKNRYQSMTGSLMWLANVSRPDLAFAINYCARFTSNPNQQHMDVLTRLMAYIAGTMEKGMFYPRNGDIDLVGYSDADYAGCLDTRKSTSGYIFMLGGCPISWTSQRQKAMATATMDAEYMAASDACKEAVWIRRFINDLEVIPHIENVPLYIDNNAALKLTKNPALHKKAKHIEVRFHYIRERVMTVGDVKTRRVNTNENVADILTKPLPLPKHQEFMAKARILSWEKEEEEKHGKQVRFNLPDSAENSEEDNIPGGARSTTSASEGSSQGES